MTRRIAVFTSSRADLGPLDPVIRALDDSEDVELVVIASGTHSNAAFGGRITDINVRDRNSVALVESGFGATSAAALAEAFAQISSGVSKVLADRRVDLILVLGDRWELLGVASAALLHGVPIAHLHGGEITEGAIDERIRHAITKLADLHLCATTDSARRIRQLGEPPWRVKVVGAPGLDRFREASTMSDRDLGALLGSPLHDRLGWSSTTPQTVDRTDVAARAEVVLSIAADTLGSVLVLHPGADPGSDAIVEVITSMAAQRGNVVHLRNAGEDYVGILSAADVLVGNSSSGIIEAASIPLAVVDVGDRQRGRAHGANVIHVETEAEAIREGIRTALSAEFRALVGDVQNPYGDGASIARIVTALTEVPLDRLLSKPLEQPDLFTPDLELCIRPGATIRDTLAAIEAGVCQIALMVDSEFRLVGTVSDGDIRRALLAGADLKTVVDDFVTTVPIVASPSDTKDNILSTMQRTKLSHLPVVAEEARSWASEFSTRSSARFS
ncbi:MAG: UDP-N-acetylglucosamine 2-epimerase (hydrolyzing) [Candidatus Microthrix sp.]|uniref:UDP-N-acetylglucosamine 2-epimerase n=1 Tax=Candidatus Neomicrothrix sp. TaxID=2719034 RepID=UPI0025BE1068|nr:UDP-N-acetylglucosamine 2-epimerase [Candidatus Microthrix sp.]MBL0203937.1 UDP-N-acetylglucosamine 2-epimerase (hydrolyzing) [Candidatus Microthrix sp.]